MTSSASLLHTHTMVAPTPRTGKHMRGTCLQLSARSDPLPAAFRTNRDPPHASTRHYNALVHHNGSAHARTAPLASRAPTPCLPPLPALADRCAARACNCPRARTRSPLLSAPTWTHPTHPRATIMHWSTTLEPARQARQAFHARTPVVCVAPTPRTGKHIRGTCLQLSARSDPLSAAFRTDLDPPTHPRHHNALVHHDGSADVRQAPQAFRAPT
jgi:hypothetical protein